MQDQDPPVDAKVDQKDKPLSEGIQDLRIAMQRVVDEDTFGRMSRCLVKCYDFNRWRFF